MIYGRDYSTTPVCADGDHECDSVTFCVACEGQAYCEDHLKQCDGCKKLFCNKHARLEKTDCGWLCENCVPEFAPKGGRMNQIESKVLEVRDRGTFIASLAIRMLAANPTQEFYFRRCGYPADGSSIMLMRLYDGKATNDPYEWPAITGDGRTMPNAHNWIIDHFNELSDGDVVDVQVILGETTEPKVSERMAHA